MDIATVPAPRAARLMYQLPPDGRLFRKLQPANQWGWPEMLLNKATYLLEVLAWQNTKDAQKGRTHTAPKMYVPDFLKKVQDHKGLNPEQELHTVDEVKNILNRPRKAA